MSVRIIAAVVCGFVLLVVASGLWLFRYAPLGNVSGVAAGVYLYDRLTGNIVWIAGNSRFVVKSQ